MVHRLLRDTGGLSRGADGHQFYVPEPGTALLIEQREGGAEITVVLPEHVFDELMELEEGAWLARARSLIRSAPTDRVIGYFEPRFEREPGEEPDGPEM